MHIDIVSAPVPAKELGKDEVGGSELGERLFQTSALSLRKLGIRAGSRLHTGMYSLSWVREQVLIILVLIENTSLRHSQMF